MSFIFQLGQVVRKFFTCHFCKIRSGGSLKTRDLFLSSLCFSKAMAVLCTTITRIECDLSDVKLVDTALNV